MTTVCLYILGPAPANNAFGVQPMAPAKPSFNFSVQPPTPNFGASTPSFGSQQQPSVFGTLQQPSFGTPASGFSIGTGSTNPLLIDKQHEPEEGWNVSRRQVVVFLHYIKSKPVAIICAWLSLIYVNIVGVMISTDSLDHQFAVYHRIQFCVK